MYFQRRIVTFSQEPVLFYNLTSVANDGTSQFNDAECSAPLATDGIV